MPVEPLRIAFTTPEYVTEEYFDGGLANYIHRVAKALAGMGHDIHVVTFSEIDEAVFDHEGVTVHRIMSSKRWAQTNRFTRYRLGTTLPFLDLSVKVYRKLKWLNTQQPLNLVQSPNYSCCGLVSICCLSVPHVLRASSYQMAWNDASGVRRKLDSWMLERFEGLQFRLGRHIYAPSHTLQQMLVKEARLPHTRVIRTPFYVETDEWDTSVYDRFLKGKEYLLFFGRFQLHKGIHTLAQALPRFLEQYPNVYAALVGRDMETSLAPSMAEYARARCGSLADRLILLEKLPHRQLYPIIAGAHLIVLPSLIENLPNACLEAMGLGKVVIGTVGTSFDELITEGANGFLVSPNDPEALAEGIISAWKHPKLAEMGAAAREKALEFSPDKTVEALLTYYREILRGGSNSGVQSSCLIINL
ncbi:MAG: glycosyltransferase family 4 protein [Pyrinomonadaceae bacterium]|nr:glycosyltransferase family 4 protein [Pyrinomonadaceae bacterium]